MPTVYLQLQVLEYKVDESGLPLAFGEPSIERCVIYQPEETFLSGLPFRLRFWVASSPGEHGRLAISTSHTGLFNALK